MAERERVRVRHDGGVAAGTAERRAGRQVALEAAAGLQQRDRLVGDEEPEGELLEARRRGRAREHPEHLVAGRPPEAHELGDEPAEQIAALPGGIDRQHLQHESGPRARGHERLALEDADEIVVRRLERQPLRLDEAPGDEPVASGQQR